MAKIERDDPMSTWVLSKSTGFGIYLFVTPKSRKEPIIREKVMAISVDII